VNFQFLSGLRVIESSAFIAAPLAGMTLAQFGADVIRIDLPGGGIDYRRLPIAPAGRSLYWTGLNKGKRSLAVDIRKPEGRALVQALVTAQGSGSGVLLTNIGTPWLSHAVLSNKRPDIITCTIEGNPDGTTAVDYTIHPATGFPAMTGNGSIDNPINSPLPAWDVACAYQAAFSIAAAVSHRQATGEGSEFRLALSDVAFSTLSHLGLMAEAEVLEQERPAIGNYVYGAFGRDFPTRDGRRIYAAAISASQWKNLVKACALQASIGALEAKLGRDFGREGDRYDAREAIAELVEAWTLKHDLTEVSRIFNETGVCWGLYQTVRQAVETDPRLSEHNPILERINTQGVGSHLAAGSAVRVVGTERGSVKPAPVVGQHTDEVLMEVLGLGSAEVGRLHDAAIVAGPAVA
jgi:2-methylfumaryl-CoA isomerase